MPKNWTPEERAAFGAKMKAAKAAKGNKVNEPAIATESTQAESQTQTQATAATDGTGNVTLTQDQFQALMSRIDKVENSPNRTETYETDTTGFSSFGKPQGVMTPYSLDPNMYKSPLSDLYDLAELRRFNLRDNYEMTWDVEQLPGDTKYGTSFVVPKFIIVLKRLDFDANNEVFRKILIQTGVFFLDPGAAVKEAVELGLPVDNANSKDFLEKMQFLRYKQWLMDIFNPQLPASTKPRLTDTVIDGKVYQIEDRSVVI